MGQKLGIQQETANRLSKSNITAQTFGQKVQPSAVIFNFGLEDSLSGRKSNAGHLAFSIAQPEQSLKRSKATIVQKSNHQPRAFSRLTNNDDSFNSFLG